MGAGASAEREAQRATREAAALERRASGAKDRAAAFEKGAAGEQRVARALAPLTAEGFHVLHDRRAVASGGNIDHVVLGPPGVFVLDAKYWSSPAVRDGKLYAGRTSRPEALERARAMAAEVTAGLTPGTVPVAAGLVFVDAPDLTPVTIDGVALLPVAELADTLRRRPPVLTAAQVEATLRTLSAALPPYDAPPVFPKHEDLVPPGGKPSADVLPDAYWCFYVTEWRAGGKHRLYLRNVKGEDRGWRDGKTGERHIPEDLNKHQRRTSDALLARIGRGGADPDAPKVPDWRYGKSPITPPLVTFVVGTRWRKGDADRLYGFIVGAKTPRTELGYVDLKTGRLFPAGEERLPGRHATKSVLLAHLARTGVGVLGIAQA